MSGSRNIVVAGYPKSGTTWLTRLTAELIRCPVKGFWGEPDKPEIAVEGQNRSSEYACYKSHHQLHELRQAGPPIEAVIYIVRDPRDVIISGSRYFRPPRFGVVGKAVRYLPVLGEVYKRVFETRDYRTRRMMKAVLYGDVEVNYWCRISWKAHLVPYAESKHMLVRYEDLLEDAQQVCRRIVGHLEIERSAGHLEKSVYKQSKDYKKREFIRKGELGKANFIRAGTHRQWEDMLSTNRVEIVNRKLRRTLQKLGYESGIRNGVGSG